MSAEEDYNIFSEIAKKVCDSAEEAAAYIDKHMEKAGHKRTTIWEDSESDDKGSKKAPWWESEPQKQTRDIPRQRGGSSGGGSGSNWPYGSSA